MHEHRKTAESDRVGKMKKLAYGMGGSSENTMQNGFTKMVYPLFNDVLRVAPSHLGIALLIIRIWDALTDPIMGYISDRSESRFGRRSPYIIGGAVAGGLLFALMWWCPRGMSTAFYLFWFVSVAIIFYTAFSVFSVPYIALGYELSADYHERTRIMSFRTWFQSIGGFALQWMFWMTQRGCFEDTIEGMRWVGIGFGGFIIIMGVVPGIFLKERSLTSAERTANREKIKLKSVLSVFNVRPFVYLVASLVTMVMVVFLVLTFDYYLNVHYLFGGEKGPASTVLGVKGSVYHICCMASIPLIVWTSTKLGKKKALLIFLLVGILGNAIRWWVITPSNPWLQLWSVFLTAPGMSAIWTLLASMTADVTDYDELKNGTRREGAFSAFYDWSMKLGIALALLVGGFILERTGFDAALKGGQSPQALRSMLLLYTVVPVVGLIISMVFVWRFPITEKEAGQIRKELEARKSENQHE